MSQEIRLFMHLQFFCAHALYLDKQRFCLLVKTFMEFVLSELKASLLALNHLFEVVKASLGQFWKWSDVDIK